MAHYQQYECPECGGRFKFLHHPDDEPPPDYCPRCGAFVGDDATPVFVPQAPHIERSIRSTADKVYRQMEDASYANAELAGEITGDGASDHAALKVTNLQDYLRPGDVAAKMPETAVSKAMGSKQGGFQPLMNMTGRDFAAATGQGAFPHTGSQMSNLITSGHAQRAREVQRAGELGRHRGK